MDDVVYSLIILAALAMGSILVIVVANRQVRFVRSCMERFDDLGKEKPKD